MLNKTFHSISRTIIKKYQSGDLPPPRPEENIYMLTFDHDLHIHLIGSQRGYLNIVATFIAPHQWRTPEGFQTLLEENIFSLRHPAMTLGYDSKSKKLVLYVRQPLDELLAENAVNMFKDFLTRAESYCYSKYLPTVSHTHDSLSHSPFCLQNISEKN